MFGCLRRFIVLFVVIFAIGYYVFTKYGDEIYANAKRTVIDFALNDLESYNIKDQEAFRKLSLLTEEYLDKLSEEDFSDAYDKTKYFFEEIKNYLSDNDITEIEFENLTKIIENE